MAVKRISPISEKTLFPGQPAAADRGDDIAVGRFRFRLVHRRVEGDQGLAIHVFGPRKGVEEEVLRFDCFLNQPHYHLGWSYRDERFIEIEAADPFAWVLERIQTGLNALLGQAGADLMEAVELEALPAAVAVMRRRGREILMSQLLRFDGGVRRDPAVEAWMIAHPGELGAIAERWFEVIRGCGEDVLELIHDGAPTGCIGDAAFAYVNAFKAHVNVGFFRGAEIADPAGLLEGTGRYMRHVKLRPEREVDAEALERLIETAYIDMKARLEAE